ncbi:MAG TPA: hypothetical protein VJB08_04830 [Candidatus Nanoarchaeia archaeon]|nr:hypothetical protein [Candidatus Nanoarchaeia archaeon]
MADERPTWVKDKTVADSFEKIECAPYDPYKDFKADPGCYVLIKPKFDTLKIHLAVCNYKHEILLEVIGSKAQGIYTKLFEYEKKHNLKWFTAKDHIAYIGKELKKAEISLALGTEYYQE